MEVPVVNDDKKHLLHLDGWRGVSLIFVLISHFYGFVYNFGYTGVTFFFVLSGLLMAKILFINKTPLPVFYRNRIARIFPVFYLYIMTIAFFSWVDHLDIRPNDLTYSTLFLRTYFGDTSIWDERILPLCHLWSLNIEEHCYMILSIIGMFAMTRSEAFARYMVTAAACMCIAFFGIYKIHPPLSPSPIFLRSECAGFALLASCSIFLWLRYLKWEAPWFVPVIACPLGVLIEAYAVHGYARFVISPLLLAISVNTLHNAPPQVLAFFRMPPLRWLGVCSYSIYIWQQVFFYMVESHPLYIRSMGLAMALATGAISFYFYEQPTRKWLRETGTRPRELKNTALLSGETSTA